MLRLIDVSYLRCEPVSEAHIKRSTNMSSVVSCLRGLEWCKHMVRLHMVRLHMVRLHTSLQGAGVILFDIQNTHTHTLSFYLTFSTHTQQPMDIGEKFVNSHALSHTNTLSLTHSLSLSLSLPLSLSLSLSLTHSLSLSHILSHSLSFFLSLCLSLTHTHSLSLSVSLSLSLALSHIHTRMLNQGLINLLHQRLIKAPSPLP